MALPLMLDDWLPAVPMAHGVERHVRTVTPLARRFVFDANACAHLGRLLYDASDLVCEQIAFAKPPFDYTYIELADVKGMFAEWRKTSGVAPTSDDRVGLFYAKQRLYTFCAGQGINDLKRGYLELPGPTLGMFATDIGHGQTKKLSTIFGDRDNLDNVKLAYLLGGMRQPNGLMLPKADYEYFLGNYDLQSTLDGSPRYFTPNAMYEAAFLGGGDILIGAACLLLIHGQKRGVTIQSVPHYRGFYKSKPRVFKSHGVVTIKLGPHDTMRKVLFGSRESPVRHDVMGTWCHYHRDRHCDHNWERLVDPDHERYKCTRCATLRSWRQAHVRGDGSKGIKTKTYSVVE